MDKLFVIVNNDTKEIARKTGYGPHKLRVYTTENRAKAALKEMEETGLVIIEYAPVKDMGKQNES